MLFRMGVITGFYGRSSVANTTPVYTLNQIKGEVFSSPWRNMIVFILASLDNEYMNDTPTGLDNYLNGHTGRDESPEALCDSLCVLKHSFASHFM